ncbi:MAG: alcohol dehydrogenase catalytic domain-containing protein [Thermodesulfobacteriota bacterium]
MAETMRATVACGPGEVGIEERPVPHPGAGEVLLRVRACGICGSDLHWYHGRYPAPSVCPGHEISAEVADVGSGVHEVKAGDLVAVEGLWSCGTCGACRSGQVQRCRRIRMVGGTVAGGLADYMLQAPHHVFRVPRGVDDEVAALTEPLAVAVHGLRLAPLEMGQRVLVLGAGTIGLMAVAAARAGGAGEVAATAKRPQQRRAALALGASAVFDPGDADGLRDWVRRHPVDVVVETVGESGGGAGDLPSTLEQGIALARRGGSVVILGVFLRPAPINVPLVLMREVRILGSVGYARSAGRADYEIALDVLAREGELLRRELITHRFELDRVDEAFRAAADKGGGAIKVSVRAG